MNRLVMPNNTKISGFYVISTLFCIYFICGCTPLQDQIQQPEHTNTHQPHIYFSLYKNEVPKIWKIIPNQKQATLLYELPVSPSQPIENILPISEIEVMQEYLAMGYKFENEQILPNFSIRRIDISPTGKKLTWIEDYDYASNRSIASFGIIRLVVFDVTTQQATILQEFVVNVYGEGFQRVKYGPIWSPNGSYIMITLGIGYDDEHILIFDVNTGQQIQKFTEFGKNLILNWAQDSTKVGGILPNKTILWCEIGSLKCQRFSLESDPTLYNFYLERYYSDWYGDENPLIRDNTWTGSKQNNTLTLFDYETNISQPLNLGMEGLFKSPRWSPSRQFASVAYQSVYDTFEYELVVFDPLTEQIIAHPSTKVGRTWLWSEDNQTLLGFVINSTFSEGGSYELSTFNLQTGIFEPIVFPKKLNSTTIGDYLIW